MASQFCKKKYTSLVLSILVTLCSFHNIYSLRILGVFPVNAKSHSIVQETVMKGLAARGHQVDVYSHFPLKKSFPNYNDISLKGTHPTLLNNMTYEFLISINEQSLKTVVEGLGTTYCELLGHPVFQNLLKNPPKYDLVVVELFLPVCYLALGRFLKAPIVGIVTNAIFSDWSNYYVGNPLNLATDVGWQSHRIAPLSFYERLVNVFETQYFAASAVYHIREQNTHVEKYFGTGYPDVMDLVRDLSLILLNSNNAVFGDRTYPPTVVQVGGIHVTESDEIVPEDIKKWIDEASSGFIYFSFGSMAKLETFPKDILAAFYKTFEAIKPVRVLLKITETVENLPPGLPSNVMTRTWFPQGKIFQHKNLKMFVTHGGLLGVLEAVHHGVPLIGISLFADQPFNIVNCVRRGNAVKVQLDSVTDGALTNAIKEILTNLTYKETAIKLAQKFKDQPMTPLEKSTFWIEYIARNGENSLKPSSLALRLPWWQNNSLDVYGFVLASILAIFYLIRKICKSLLCLGCKGQKLKRS